LLFVHRRIIVGSASWLQRSAVEESARTSDRFQLFG
jgi:hypothetical protein